MDQPVVQISIVDLKKGLPVDAGLYKAEIDSYIQRPKNDIIQHVFTAVVEGGSFDGHLVTFQFQSNYMGFTRPFLAALSGKPEKVWLEETIKKMEVEGLETIPFDGNKCIGQKIGIKVIKTPNPTGGDPYTNVDGFLPYNSMF